MAEAFGRGTETYPSETRSPGRVSGAHCAAARALQHETPLVPDNRSSHASNPTLEADCRTAALGVPFGTSAVPSTRQETQAAPPTTKVLRTASIRPSAGRARRLR